MPDATGTRVTPKLRVLFLQTLHWPFDDPTQVEGSMEARLRTVCRVWDQIDPRVRAWLAELEVSAYD